MTPWTDLGGGVRVRQSRAYAMNSVLLLEAGHAVLVDPGVLPSELDDLAAAVHGGTRARGTHAGGTHAGGTHASRGSGSGSGSGSGAPDVTLVFTHSHWDHVLGRPWWPGATTAGHAGLAAALARDAAAILADAASCARELGEPWVRGFAAFAPDVEARGQTVLPCGPWRLVLRDAPGHCEEQITVHVPARRLLVAGDLLSDREIPWLDREPAAYRNTVAGIGRLVEEGAVETLIPGHGAVAHGAPAVRERIRRDLAYLDALDSGVREARARGLTPEEAQAALAPLVPGGNGASGPMAEAHRGNVRICWERFDPA